MFRPTLSSPLPCCRFTNVIDLIFLRIYNLREVHEHYEIDNMSTGMVDNLLQKLNLKATDPDLPAKEPSEDEVKELREKYEKANQEHVFAFYDELNIADKVALYTQLQGFDPDRINVLADKASAPS